MRREREERRKRRGRKEKHMWYLHDMSMAIPP